MIYFECLHFIIVMSKFKGNVFFVKAIFTGKKRKLKNRLSSGTKLEKLYYGQKLKKIVCVRSEPLIGHLEALKKEKKLVLKFRENYRALHSN
jgi:hypothetical protein